MGLSDFHLNILTVLKSGAVKRGPRIVEYRDYSKFDPVGFESDNKNNIAGDNKACLVFENFNSIIEELMNKHAPTKQKYLRGNDAQFMTKTLRTAIMLRAQLRNRLNKHNGLENSKAYKNNEVCVQKFYVN